MGNFVGILILCLQIERKRMVGWLSQSPVLWRGYAFHMIME